MSALALAVSLALAQQTPVEVETPEGDILYEVPLSDAERLFALEEKVARLEARPKAPATGHAGSPVTVFGYSDFGFFVPTGDGSGYRQDFANAAFPEYAGRFGWVFYGDLLAPTVNSRGEAADLGTAPGVTRLDSVRSRGAPGFILSVLNLGARVAVGETLLFSGSVNFAPRTGSDFALGDGLDVDLAQLEWMPTRDRRLSLFAGKMESAIGVEYRQRRAPDRFGVTPSLLARYTTGTPLGIKARWKFLPGDLLTVAVALTNGSSTTEQFHFFDELDSNLGKTVSGRLSVKPFALLLRPSLGELEVGVSGQWGSQDRARDSLHPMWFLGVDLLWWKDPVSIEAQWLRGMADGDAAQQVYGLRLNHGGYLTVTWRIIPLLGVLVRGEFRDALVWLGDERLYLTRSYRLTFGARLTFDDHVSLKAEYLLNGEYGGVPFVPNDVFTSSLVVAF